LREELTSFLPDYDEDRVYDTDIRKLFQWYNILVDKGYVLKEEEGAEADSKEVAAASEEE
jgi:hypothetical protein